MTDYNNGGNSTTNGDGLNNPVTNNENANDFAAAATGFDGAANPEAKTPPTPESDSQPPQYNPYQAEGNPQQQYQTQANPQQGQYQVPNYTQQYQQPQYNQNQQPYGQNQKYGQYAATPQKVRYNVPPEGYPQKSRIAAALLAVMGIGAFGVHNFYLGKYTRGLIQLLVSVIFCWLVLPLLAMAIWALIEGVQMLLGNENWMYDGNGVILKD